MVLDDQTISPGSPKVTKDSDEVVQLLVTVEIENGDKQSELEKTSDLEEPPESQEAETVTAVEDAVQNGEEKPQQPCEEVQEVEDDIEPSVEPDEKPVEELISSGTFLKHFLCRKYQFEYF